MKTPHTFLSTLLCLLFVVLVGSTDAQTTSGPFTYRVVSGKVEIDAISGLHSVPEPSTWALLISGGSLALVCFRNRKS